MTSARQPFSKVFIVLATLLLAVSFPAMSRAGAGADDLVLEDGPEATLLTQADLSDDRGAGGPDNSVVSTQSLAATTSGNTLSVTGDLMNGTINLGSSFGGSGFGSYVMNTGNNSTLTAATSVTIQMGGP